MHEFGGYLNLSIRRYIRIYIYYIFYFSDVIVLDTKIIHRQIRLPILWFKNQLFC